MIQQLALATVLLVSSGAFAAECTDVSAVVETRPRTNLRAGPGVQHKVVYTAPATGSEWVIRERCGDWLRIEGPRPGWVAQWLTCQRSRPLPGITQRVRPDCEGFRSSLPAKADKASR